MGINMETAAKFPTSADANEALEALKSRGIAAALLPDEARGGMWQGDLHHVLGYRLDVEPSRVQEAREYLRQIGFLVFDDDPPA
jgi:hypothetical protein